MNMLSVHRTIIRTLFKLQVVSEVERGELSKKATQRKYGIRGNATILTWIQKYSTFRCKLSFIKLN